jgi:uncharacterized membrane protein
LSSLLVAFATFLAAGVEWVEALTIVLAVGIFKSWRTAILATVAALGVLLALIVIFNLTITAYVSISLARTVVGVGLLLFGLGWLYKAILRSSGLKAQRSEADEYEGTREEVMTHGHAFGTAFGGVFLEGLEVVFIVVALGGRHRPEASTHARSGESREVRRRRDADRVRHLLRRRGRWCQLVERRRRAAAVDRRLRARLRHLRPAAAVEAG